MKRKLDEHISNVLLKLIQKSKNIFFYRDDNGTYVLFEKYLIVKNEDNIVTVVNKFNRESYEFVNYRNATAYAILDFNNKINSAKRLQELDKKMASTLIDKKIHLKIKTIKDKEKQEIYRDKLIQDQIKLSEIQREIDKYIIQADTYQFKGFKNELK